MYSIVQEFRKQCETMAAPESPALSQAEAEPQLEMIEMELSDDDALQAGPSDGSGGPVSFEDAVKQAKSQVEDLTLCYVCLQHPRLNKQCYGARCQAVVIGAYWDAKSQGEAAKKAYGLSKKRRGAPFRDAILVYSAKCIPYSSPAGVSRLHRTVHFAWVRYVARIEVGTHTHKGTRMVWISRMKFVKEKMEDDECTELEGFAAFEREWQSLPDGRKFGDGKARRILWPIDHFVEGYNSFSSMERTEWGTKVLCLHVKVKFLLLR